MNALEWQAKTISGNGALLAHALRTTPEDKLDWKASTGPESKTRSPLDIAAECIHLNRRFTALLRGESPGAWPEGRPFSTPAEAIEQVQSSANEFSSAVSSLDDSILEKTYTTGVGELPGALVITIPAMNMSYHHGQICYIQTLLGDAEDHWPEGMF